MNILVIGSGGREHALAWKISQSPKVKTVFVAPGNGGTSSGDEKIVSVQLEAKETAQLVDFAQKNQVKLVVVGPEQPLVDGILKVFKAVGIDCFGPSQEAARLEGSKAFSKDFMKQFKIPTAAYETFTDYQKAIAYINGFNGKLVIKASGLAAGKGVLLPETKEEALAGVKSLMVDKIFGAAGEEVVIEEFLEGEEVSILAFSDGYTAVPLPPSQDHKRIFDGDQGPNTGGMGAYAPAPVATKSLMKNIQENVLNATLKGMRKLGHPFVGLLYAGIMVTRNGPKVLEYNCRFGDPETQVVLPLLQTDLVEVLFACVEGRLDGIDVKFSEGAAATVVGASAGYPESYAKGKVITIDEIKDKSITVFHAGTSQKSKGEPLLTSGGRVVAVTGTGATLEEAVDKAYKGIKAVHFEGIQFRSDIAHRALKRGKASVTYAEAGVDVDKGEEFVDFIKPLAKSTMRTGSVAGIGGFGGIFDIKPVGYKDPLLVSGTDGVGTKLKIAQLAGIHNTIGIDLVAMSVNDLVVQGAEPFFFLDYFATSHLDLSISNQVIVGVVDACKESNCQLLGGETAEMPGLYQGDDYDLAGFAVGAVERDQVLPMNIAIGDTLLALPSSGLHSNGFSLVRYLIEKNNIDYHAPPPFPADPKFKTLAEALLVPTRLYVRSCVPLAQKNLIQGLAHITGGGLIENIPRILPEGTAAVLDAAAWDLPPVFRWLAKLGNVASHEVARTFNCGIGMIVVVKNHNVEKVLGALKEINEPVFKVGHIAPLSETHGKTVLINNIDKWNL